MVAVPSRPFYWPGGIPLEIQIDPTGDIDPKDDNEAKGWMLFVESGHDLPLINILEGAKARDEFRSGFDGARDGWMEDIEIYAPGNLEMKRQGMRLTTTIPV
ncbi:hypothetical protein BDQ94DRAFT_167958 [Aspergillus welwitschiae]|uniref:Uncharacterized protein n=1 Tax=Aspergillus welwitschiae TaxID=1341132 RepID=A0A3F3QAZ3_9EURO|nr:hypothetical protein BDQ94DRAFT_167958 [Aspergillus welwitschiae]RDH36343.1 hypothetical protein BDQ94DRAFT_167958 [Aspergillus welwitschiae]